MPVPSYLLFQKLLTEPEICQNDVSVAVQQDVFQLDVSVNDPQLQEKNTKATRSVTQRTVSQKSKLGDVGEGTPTLCRCSRAKIISPI